MSRSILLVDDDPSILDLLARFFDRRGWDAHRAVTGAGALEQYDRERTALVLLDLDLPDASGLAVLQRLRERDPDVTVLMLTGHAEIEAAVEAMRLGAENFLTKPIELDHLGAAVDRAAEKAELRRQNRFLAGAGAASADREALGTSPLMRELAGLVDRAAAGASTVLLEGETGTGKGWVARAIHDRSDRHGEPFVEVSCGGLPATILEAELFGHESGAFIDASAARPGLFAVAGGGTIFLNEIGDLAPELQPRLLEVLETGRFRRVGGTRERRADVRLVAATNRDLRPDVRAGRFREDLYYRLAVLTLRLPPLRERAPEDIGQLAYSLLEELRRKVGTTPSRIGDDALEVLVRHAWPGNIRELRNVLERIAILGGGGAGDEIRAHHLPPEMRRGEAVVDPAEALTLAEVERRHILRVLESNEGNRSRSARVLGISRATLYEKLDRYGLRTVGR
ncbi:MAG TPA: sigma-54 dependent transcriptional regulator [Longimicrobiales bacterium]|nr:sigma-54 dependent transcriptional regulator [Longimicrobiales bacterium]